MPLKAHIVIIYTLLALVSITQTIFNRSLTQEPELALQVTETPTSTSVEMIQLHSDNPSVEAQIREIAREENFQWPDFLVKLAHCESKLDPKASNSKGNTPVGSTDRGVFQINNYWHKNISDECAYDIDCATRYTIKLINEGKQNLWTCNQKVKGVPIEIVMSW